MAMIWVCVRYRYDEAAGLRIKTAEIIVERKPWTAREPSHAADEIVAVRIGVTEKAYQRMARAAGGRWEPDAKVWLVSYGSIKGTELEKHIILDAGLRNEESKSI